MHFWYLAATDRFRSAVQTTRSVKLISKCFTNEELILNKFKTTMNKAKYGLNCASRMRVAEIRLI